MDDEIAIGAFARLTDLSGCAGLVFAAAALLVGFAGWLPPVRRLPLARRRQVLVATAVGAVLLMCWPIRGLPVVAYLRAVTEDLSITALVLAGGVFMRALAAGVRPPGSGGLALTPGTSAPGAQASAPGWNAGWRDRTALRVLVIVGALLLYPMALGATPVDSYRWGYANPWFVAALLVIALAALRARLRLTVVCLSLAVLSYGLGLYESRNPWNYLIDPFVAIQCALALPLGALRRLFGVIPPVPSPAPPAAAA